MGFSEKMLATVKKYNMINYGDFITVALSGGADSVSLLLGFLELKETYNLSINAVHINHMLRGKDADDDMEFCESLCKKYGVTLHTLKKDVNEYAVENKLSLEDAGRKVRYEYLNKISSHYGSKIATAHNKNDNSENFFISMLRGTRIMGIPPKRDNIIRPLINIKKSEIYDFLKEISEVFVTDKTNFSDDYFRNKVRLKLIPYIEENFSVNLADSLSNNLEVIHLEDDYIENEAKKYEKAFVKWENETAKIKIADFKDLHKALKRRIIRNIYYKTESSGYISLLQTDSVIDLESNQSGKSVTLPKGVVAQISYNYLIFNKQKCIKEFFYKTKIGELFISEINKKITMTEEGNTKQFFTTNYDDFTVRNKRNGDKIFIKGVGHKKLSDFFTDRKIPKDIRDTIPVIEDEEGICAVGNIYFRKDNMKNKVYVYIN